MRKVVLLAVAAAAVLIAVWSNAGSRSTTEISVSKAMLGPSLSGLSKSLAPPMSIWEIHNQAHLENLPVQEVDDKTFIFTASTK